MESIGAFVRFQRQRLGWTQQELADRSGVGLNFVYQLEKEKPTVRLDTTNQVLNALGYEVGIRRYFSPWREAVDPQRTKKEEPEAPRSTLAISGRSRTANRVPIAGPGAGF